MTDVPPIDTPFGPIRVHVSDHLPDGVDLIAYSPPPPGSKPGNPDEDKPDWIPLEKRAAIVVNRDH